MNQFNVRVKSFGNSALLIEWPDRIDESILRDILCVQSHLEQELCDLDIETINAYNSLTVILNSNSSSLTTLEEKIRKIIAQHKTKIVLEKKIWRIPVCYEGEFGIDLAEIATSTGLSVDELIELHTTPQYTVYFTGFLPGFLYLGGLVHKLFTPRKSTPRLRIMKGAVAIGGNQTGIYPSESPGGWNIIGNSPLNFFDAELSPPCFAKAGDHLEFYSIKKNEYDMIKKAVEKKSFQIECVIQ